MNKFTKEIRKFTIINDKTLALLSAYKKAALPLPFGLKGNMGEFFVAIELMKKFPNSDFTFKGGAYPGVDMMLDGKKVQVKTSFNPYFHKKNRNGYAKFESCPTVKKNVIDNKLCDFIVFVSISPSINFSKIDTINIYIFSKKDFKYFKTALCWSGKSKGDRTIANIFEIIGKLPSKFKKELNVYNTPAYKKLFKESKGNWAKFK